MAKMTKAQEAERQEAIEKLRQWLKPGDTVYTILRHVSRSGMQREIGVVILDCENNEVVDLHPNYLVAKVLGERQGSRDGIIVGGCGMDMGFHLVYSLSSVLYGHDHGYHCLGDRKCPSNQHVNPGPDRDNFSTDQVHHDGYALHHRWL